MIGKAGMAEHQSVKTGVVLKLRQRFQAETVTIKANEVG
jgi:hypothetical protein